MGKESAESFKQKDIERIAATQAKYNNLNQQTPFGSLEFTGPNPAAGITPNTAITRLSPQEQAILEQQQAARLMAGQTGAGSLGAYGQSGDAVERAYFQRALGLLNPEFDRREGALQQRLANQGLPQTSGAYNREYGRFETGVNQQLEQAAMASVLAGSQERTAEVNRIMGLLGMGQAASPQFINPTPITIPVGGGGGGGMSPMQGALGGAASGAAMGTAIMPGWGTAIGAGAGLLMGGMAARG